MIYFTSDLHFCHDREFMFKPRGFTNILDHDRTIIENWNAMIKDTDDVYILGDLMLSDVDTGLKYIKQLKGKLHIILGNHDTPTKIRMYETCTNIVEICYSLVIRCGKRIFYLSHYPTLVGDIHNPNAPKKIIYNLYGHTHQNTNFYNDIFFMYHVGLDSHNNRPVSIDQVISDCSAKNNIRPFNKN